MAVDEVRMDPLSTVPRRTDGRVDLDTLVACLGPATMLLESTPGTPHAERWSYVAVATGTTLFDDGSTTVLLSPEGAEPLGSDPFVAIDRLSERFGLHPDATMVEDEPPFTGGLVGALSYDLARRIERLPDGAVRDRSLPHLHFEVVPTLIAVDHDHEESWLVERSFPGVRGPGRDHVLARLRGADAQPAPAPVPPSATPVVTSLPKDRYLAAVSRVLEHIGAGDVFQVNVTQRLSASWEAGLGELYRRLRQVSPAPHGALLPGAGLASISPETFLSAHGRHVRSRPMKGTRPRSQDPALDGSTATELAASAKDRAENVMIVDLLRNDLGRVCDHGSVTVPSLCELEGHPSVWQLVSTIDGRLGHGCTWGDLLRATFPCGSVTGTPKVAAMELIERVEPVRRGWYCGAIGFIGSGALRLSVAIRTATLHGGRADYGTGGGVVADSDPDAEWAESMVKAKPFLQAVDGRLAGANA